MKFPERWREMSPLFDELFELDDAARASRLREIDSTDPDLAQQLRAMLGAAQFAKAHRFPTLGPQLDVLAELGLRGRRIGPYVIEDELGQGGSGSVWKARLGDSRPERFVALKLLHRSLLGPSGVARFRREGALLSRLSHPDIVRLLDTGLTPDGQPFLVLEYVDGQPIDQHCDLLRVGLRGRLALLHELMDSIGHAHAQRIVHRDIKPSNILVTPEGRIKLLDFGIAKLLESEPEVTLITVDGQRNLTPRYAAPEQLEGAPVSAATDIYALGVLMYRLLVGCYPTSVDAASAAEVITGTLTAEPATFGSALERMSLTAGRSAQQIAASRGTTVQGLRRALCGGLDAIVSRALRKLPSQRYGSVAAFAADIARYLDRQSIGSASCPDAAVMHV
jgi:serine/threonine-protein kinase